MQSNSPSYRWKLPSTSVRVLGIVATLVWAAAVGACLERLWHFSSKPGAAASAPAGWPGSTLISPQPDRATLVMFVHPRCACSRASLAELRSIMERTRGPLSTWVVFVRPNGTPSDWQKTPTWEAAQNIAGVHVLTDEGGSEAVRFGAATSGHVVLYDPAGRLVFSGGITAARGHVGKNTGEERVVSLLNGGAVDRHEHAVYGCGFRDRDPSKI